MVGPPDTGRGIAYPVAARIASGDREAIEAFVRERAGAVRAYCAVVVAPGEIADAVVAAFVGCAEAVARAPAAGGGRPGAALPPPPPAAGGRRAGGPPPGNPPPCA